MKRVQPVAPGSAIAFVSVLALLAGEACDPDPKGQTPVAIDQTTSALVARSASVPLPGICVAEEAQRTTASPSMSGGQNSDGELRLTSFPGSQNVPMASEPGNVYDRVPLHEPGGAMYGDVGMP